MSSSASYPASAASSTIARVTPRSRKSRPASIACPPGAASATSAGRVLVRLDRHITVPASRGGARHPGLAVGVGEELEGDRRHQEGNLQLGAEDGRLGRDVRDVDQDARPQLPALVRLGVAAQGALVAGAAGEVAVRAGLELLERQPLEVGDVDRIGDAKRLFGDRRQALGSVLYGGN